ncbi:MAG: hypothetical protein QOF89_2319 [Acidobacteriota bacterium]|jgi:hypothetical protein|nr:hypothetical protein [Acidobacteriota bacterium]
MKKPVLVLLAFLSLIPFAQARAQTPAAVPPANPVAAPTPDVAQFLAALSGGPAQTPNDLVPAPSFMTGCTSSYECPTGQLCCYLCGNPPADGDDSSCRACITPYKGRCPLVV